VDALKVQFIDRKGFSLDEWLPGPIAPVVTKRFPLEPTDPDGERSIEVTFQRESQEGMTLVYREVLKP
jgi:hypothetical protein